MRLKGLLLITALTVTTFRRRMDFSQEFITSVRLMGEVLANALARRDRNSLRRRHDMIKAELRISKRNRRIDRLKTAQRFQSCIYQFAFSEK